MQTEMPPMMHHINSNHHVLQTIRELGLEGELNYVDCIKFKCLDWHNFFLFFPRHSHFLQRIYF